MRDRLSLVNKTLHPVTVFDDDGQALATWPEAGGFTRLVEDQGPPMTLDTDQGTVPTRRMRYTGDIEGLPPEAEGTAYIVSRVLAAAVSRGDLYFPLEEVRDARGGIIGCRALGQFDNEEGSHAD